MAEDNKRLLILGSKSGGGGGAATWGQITGDLANQTDLKDALDAKADSSSIPTATSDLTNDSGYITLSDVPAQTQADWNQSDSTQVDFIKNKPTLGTMASESASDYTPTSGLATVATTGSYPDLHNKPTIPVVNDATITLQDDGGTTIDSFTLNQSSNKTITIPSGGGGGSQWFGTQAQFNNLGTYDDDTDYYISDKLDYNTDIKNKPDLSSYATKTEVNTKNLQQDFEIAGKMSGHFMTQAEFDQITPLEGQNYFIEGNTVEMVVTFTDQTTATYNVVVD